MTTTPKPVVVKKRAIVPIPDNIKAEYKIEGIAQRSRFIHILLSAPGGQGKTTFFGTTAKQILDDNGEGNIPVPNLLVIEFDPFGEDTLIDMKVGYDIVRPKSIQELEYLVKFLHSSGADQYDVIALDAYNKMCEILYDAILEYAKTLPQRTPHDLEILELRDYNRFYKRLRVLNESILSLKKHVIFTCIAALKDKPSELWKEKQDRAQIQSLMVDGKMAHILSTQFSLHGIMERRGAGSNIHVDTKFTEFNSESKTRFRIKGTFEDMTFPDLLTEMNLNDPSFRRIKWKHDEKGFLPELV